MNDKDVIRNMFNIVNLEQKKIGILKNTRRIILNPNNIIEFISYSIYFIKLNSPSSLSITAYLINNTIIQY